MEENLYLNLARADIMCSFKDKVINIDEFKYLYRQLNDDELFFRLVFEIYRSLNSDKSYNNLKDVIFEERYFIENIISSIKQLSNKDINVNSYVALWMYLIYIKNNNCFNVKMKGEYLNDISPSFIVDRYFLLEYYNSLMDVVMENEPIDIVELNSIKNKVREIM